MADLVKGWETERKSKAKDLGGSTDGGVDSDNRETEDDAGLVAGTDEGSGVDVAEESVDETPPPSKSTRSKTKGKGKK